MREDEYGPNLSIQEAAAYCGYAPDTVKVLIELRAGIHLMGRRGFRKIDIQEARWLRGDFPDPNDALPPRVKRPLFALHDDGRWWPLLSRSDASAYGKQRYFEGTPCEHGHTVKRYTKTGKCIDCCQVANGKKTSKEKRVAKNSAASPGRNLP